MSVFDSQHLSGLEYISGKQDCYGLIRRYYQECYSVTLTNYARPIFFWDNGLNFIDDCFEKEGFDSLIPGEKMRIGDLLCMNVASSMPNHLAIYVGGGKILHHLFNCFSTHDDWNWKWKNRTLRTIRRRDLSPQEPKRTMVQFHEISKAQVLKNEDFKREIERTIQSRS